MQAGDQAAGVPAVAAEGLHVAVELIDSKCEFYVVVENIF